MSLQTIIWKRRRTEVVEDGGCQCLTAADTQRKDHVRASTPRLTDSHQTLWHRPQVRFYELRREVRPAPAGHATRADGDETSSRRSRSFGSPSLGSRRISIETHPHRLMSSLDWFEWLDGGCEGRAESFGALGRALRRSHLRKRDRGSTRQRG